MENAKALLSVLSRLDSLEAVDSPEVRKTLIDLCKVLRNLTKPANHHNRVQKCLHLVRHDTSYISQSITTSHVAKLSISEQIQSAYRGYQEAKHKRHESDVICRLMQLSFGHLLEMLCGIASRDPGEGRKSAAIRTLANTLNCDTSDLTDTYRQCTTYLNLGQEIESVGFLACLPPDKTSYFEKQKLSKPVVEELVQAWRSGYQLPLSYSYDLEVIEQLTRICQSHGGSREELLEGNTRLSKCVQAVQARMKSTSRTQQLSQSMPDASSPDHPNSATCEANGRPRERVPGQQSRGVTANSIEAVTGKRARTASTNESQHENTGSGSIRVQETFDGASQRRPAPANGTGHKRRKGPDGTCSGQPDRSGVDGPADQRDYQQPDRSYGVSTPPLSDHALGGYPVGILQEAIHANEADSSSVTQRAGPAINASNLWGGDLNDAQGTMVIQRVTEPLNSNLVYQSAVASFAPVSDGSDNEASIGLAFPSDTEHQAPAGQFQLDANLVSDALNNNGEVEDMPSAAMDQTEQLGLAAGFPQWQCEGGGWENPHWAWQYWDKTWNHSLIDWQSHTRR